MQEVKQRRHHGEPVHQNPTITIADNNSNLGMPSSI